LPLTLLLPALQPLLFTLSLVEIQEHHVYTVGEQSRPPQPQQQEVNNEKNQSNV
jgi:hypothetical protein